MRENAELIVAQGGELINNGILANEGTLTVEGTLTGNAPTGNSAQPWLNAYYAITVTGEDLSGAVTVPREQRSAFREKWNPYWLETVAPLLGPGYRLRLR